MQPCCTTHIHTYFRLLPPAATYCACSTCSTMLPPAAGLDPASRQLLWKVIKAARRDRAGVLTTHSMEEAEALCDR